MTVDDKLKELLKELGDKINESISTSDDVNSQIQRIRDEGYDLYVFLDATIGLGKDGQVGTITHGRTVAQLQKDQTSAVVSAVQFRINVKDLAFLRSVGIDPTRKVKSGKKNDGKKPSGEPGPD